LDLSLSEVQDLNPHVKRLTTPRNDPEFTLYLPEGSKDKFLTEIAAIPEDMRVTWRKHRVEEGDSLSVVAKKYHTTVSAVAQANNLRADSKVQIGDKLIIPVTLARGTGKPAEINGSQIRYSVQRGDTVASIAREFDLTIAQIQKWNKLHAKSKLRAGRTLLLYTPEPPTRSASSPKAGKVTSVAYGTAAKGSRVRVTHRVKKGDTLFTIATNYKTTIDSIRDWNNLSQNNIRVGDRLTIYMNR
jgi:membrane-bound lytic murein transglycosylase D